MSGKKKTIIIVALLMVVFIGSISYALWSVTLEQTDSNVLKTGCFEVGLIENTDEINLPEEYPVTDEKGRSYSPFTFTIQNTCTVDSSYSVNLKVGDATTLNTDYLKTVLNTDMAQVLTAYDEVDTGKYQLTTGTLRGASAEGAGDGESVTYDLRLWLDQDTPKTEMSKDFYGKIVIENITTTISE